MNIIKRIFCGFVVICVFLPFFAEDVFGASCGAFGTDKYKCPKRIAKTPYPGGPSMGYSAGGFCGCLDGTYFEMNCEYDGSGTYWQYEGECSQGTRKKRSYAVKKQNKTCPGIERVPESDDPSLPATLDIIMTEFEYGEWQNANDECSTECLAGKEQYQADNECGYTTNRCCSNGYWSGFNGECSGAMACDGTTSCWNGSTCETKNVEQSCQTHYPQDSNISGGVLTRTASCKIGNGWQYGSWTTGPCECSYEYEWEDNECQHRCRNWEYVWDCLNCKGSTLLYFNGICTCSCAGEYNWNFKDHVCQRTHNGMTQICKPV